MVMEAPGQHRRALHGRIHALSDGRHRCAGIPQERHPAVDERRTAFGFAGRQTLPAAEVIDHGMGSEMPQERMRPVKKTAGILA